VPDFGAGASSAGAGAVVGRVRESPGHLRRCCRIGCERKDQVKRFSSAAACGSRRGACEVCVPVEAREYPKKDTTGACEVARG
jgi:hypothetical protein